MIALLVKVGVMIIIEERVLVQWSIVLNKCVTTAKWYPHGHASGSFSFPVK